MGCLSAMLSFDTCNGNRGGFSVCAVKNSSVVVNFVSQVIFVFLLFLGMLMSADEVETKEK